MTTCRPGYRGDEDIGDKIWVITGGASGVMLGLARALFARGGQVVMADIKIARADAMPKELGPKACAAAADVRSTDSSDALAARAPHTLVSETHNVLEVVKRLKSENGQPISYLPQICFGIAVRVANLTVA